MEIAHREKYLFWMVLLVPVFASVYYALLMPVSYDEAWTFLHFTQNGIVASASHYPAPNNHVLHSIVTNLTYHLPFSNLLKLRISVLLVNFLVLLATFRFVKKHFDATIALIVVAISSVLFLNIYYSYMSRGYSLVSLFFILALDAAFGIVRHANKRNWLLFGLSSILGFYTMPSFLYPFVMLNFFILYYNRKYICAQIFTNLVVVTIVFVLYLPIISNDGFESIVNNRFVKPIGLWQTLKTMPFYYPVKMAEITGIHWSILIVLMLISLWKLWKMKDPNLIFVLIMFLGPFVLLTIQRVIPYARVFCYYGFVFVLIAVLPYRLYFNRIANKMLIFIVLVLQNLLVFNFNHKIDAYENKDLAANITAAQIIPKIIGSHTYLFNFSLLKANLEFELVSKGIHNYKIDSVNISNMSADTISNYDYIIINKDFDRTKSTQAIFKTPYYNIYKKIPDSH